jgi:hypothetical protein
MNEAIEIVQAMYDEALREYSKHPPYMMESAETATRINTLAYVLWTLRRAMTKEGK